MKQGRKVRMMLLLLALLCCSCVKKTGETYVTTENSRNSNRNVLDISTGVTKDDTTKCRAAYNGIAKSTTDGTRVLIGEQFLKVYDKMSQNIYIACTVPGCNHSMSEGNCEARQKSFVDALYWNEGLYTINGSTLSYEKNQKPEIIYTNEKTTEAASYTRGDYACDLLTLLPLTKQKLLLAGSNFLFSFDVEKKTAGELIEICPEDIRDMIVMDEDTVFLCSDAGDLYRVRVSEDEVRKLGAYHTTKLIAVKDGWLYFIDDRAKRGDILRVDREGEKEEQIGTGAYYLTWMGGNGAILMNRIGENNVFLLKDGVETCILDIDKDYPGMRMTRILNIGEENQVLLFFTRRIADKDGFLEKTWYAIWDFSKEELTWCGEKPDRTEGTDAPMPKERIDTSEQYGSFSRGVQVFSRLEDGTKLLPGATYELTGDIVRLTVILNQLNTSSADGLIPMDVYAVCEGEFLPLSLEGETMDTVCHLNFVEDREQKLDFVVGSPENGYWGDMNTLYLLLVIDPEFVPKSFLAQIDLTVIVPISVDTTKATKKASAPRVTPKVSEEDYCEAEDGEGTFLEIGASYETTGKNGMFSGEYALVPKEDLAFKGKTEEGVSGGYFLLFMDGRFIPAFDGAYALFCENKPGEVMNISLQDIEGETGMVHVFQAIWLPDNESWQKGAAKKSMMMAGNRSAVMLS